MYKLLCKLQSWYREIVSFTFVTSFNFALCKFTNWWLQESSLSMSSEARQQAQAEKLTLLVAETRTGYYCVAYRAQQRKPYQAQVWRGKSVSLGYFATAEEAALCVARSPEGQAKAAERAAAAAPLTSEEARQQAQAEGLELVVAENKTGYHGVHFANPGSPKPYKAQVWRGRKKVHLGTFATAEEAALCVARSQEGQQQAAAAAAAAERSVEERAVAMHRAAERALAALAKGKKRCR